METIVISILQMRRLKHRGIQLLAQGLQSKRQAWEAGRFAPLPLPTPSPLQSVVLRGAASASSGSWLEAGLTPNLPNKTLHLNKI